ncbi:MAG: hypothetical protein IKX85_05725, partial [Clostridia bacterium]|nr:hypothetical protein [Clostridia bacterium]
VDAHVFKTRIPGAAARQGQARERQKQEDKNPFQSIPSCFSYSAGEGFPRIPFQYMRRKKAG